MKILIDSDKIQMPKSCGECWFYKKHETVDKSIAKRGYHAMTRVWYTDCYEEPTSLFGPNSTWKRPDCPLKLIEGDEGDGRTESGS